MQIVRLLACAALAPVLLACSALPVNDTAPKPLAAPCPAELDKLAACYTGEDGAGSHYWIAIPHKWNRTLVMHAHGGPRLSPVKRESSIEDLERFAVTVRQGYAWAGSSYRRPGYGVRMAAEDTDNLRRIFIAAFGQPASTILHGQSWGGNVAAKGIELYGKGGHYDGLLLTNGMMAGGTKNYLHRLDLRVVYQYYCNNHPKPAETQYPLWMGLPADARLTSKELEARVDECTGVKQKPEQRTEQQKKNLANILGVVRVPERTLVSHLNWATFMFRDLTQRVLGGRNPFPNRHVVYAGSSDDAALNKGVARYDADPEALRQLADDSDMSGDLPVPAISLHAIHDPTAMVEYEAEYRDIVAAKGKRDRLLQLFTNEHDHSKLSDAEYAAVFDALVEWARSGRKPTPEQVAALCARYAATIAGGCHFDTRFTPGPLRGKVAARNNDSTGRRPD